MSDHGFYHPEIGYWQTNADVPDDIRAGYPDGTVEVPLMPEAGAIWGGNQWLPAPPQILTAEDYRLVVQAHVDAVAVARLYDSGVSLASYVASTNATWAAEAQAFVAWRDAVWAQVYAMWGSPPDPVPSPAEVVAGLPVIEWPGAQE